MKSYRKTFKDKKEKAIPNLWERESFNMKKKLILLVVSIFASISLAAHLEAVEEIEYTVFQHGGFSVEYPDWKVEKKAEKGRLLLKVTKGACAVQVELFESDFDTVYGEYVKALRKSGAFVNEDPSQYILVQRGSFFFMKLIFYKKFFADGENTYVVTVASKRSAEEKYAPLRARVFNSGKGTESTLVEDDAAKTFALEEDEEYPFGIYLTDSQGSFLKRVYKSRHHIEEAKLSHDGKKIVFSEHVGLSGRADTIKSRAYGEICVINRDGSGYRVLTQDKFADMQPNWSADNRHIIFTSDRSKRPGRYDLDIFVMDEDGGNLRSLTNSPDVVDADSHAYGGKIAFTKSAAGRVPQSIWIMNEDGSNVKQLTHPTRTGKSKVGYYFGDFDPNISFDGKKIVFESLEDDNYKVFGKRVGRYSIKVMNIDGSQIKNISRGDLSEGIPHWTPDGRIVFMAVGGKIDSFKKLFIVNSDGSERQRLIKTKPGMFLHGRPAASRGDTEAGLIVFSGEFFK